MTGSEVQAGGGDRGAQRLVWAACAVALAPLLALVTRFNFVCDDAYITYRYARNVARGLGPRFNEGVEPPVEGYSEFLWVLAMSVVEAVGADPAFWSRVGSVACGIAVLLLVVRWIARRFDDSPTAVIGASLFLGALPPLAVWTTGGMGTMPFVLAVVLAWVCLFQERDRPRGVAAGIAFAAAVLLRADGALWVAALGATGLVAGALERDRALLRGAVVASMIPLVVFAAHVAWRLSYYGDWLPNTARVKVGFTDMAVERGTSYVLHFAATFPGVAVALLVALAGGRRLLDRAVLAALVAVTATVGYAVAVGGDFMCFGRFLVPALPFTAVLLAVGLAGIERGLGRAASGGVAVLCTALAALAAFDVHVVPESVRSRFRFRWNVPQFFSEVEQWQNMRGQAGVWSELGRALKGHTPPGSSLVYGAVGGIGYFSERFMFDRNGLITREVALRDPLPKRTSPGHDKAVPKAFFMKDRPTYLDAFLWPEDQALPPGVDASKLVAVPLDGEALGIQEGWTLYLEPYDAP